MSFESRFPVVKEMLDDIYLKRRTRLALAIEYLIHVKEESPSTFTERDHMAFNEIAVVLAKYTSDPFSDIENVNTIDPLAITFEAYEKVMAQSLGPKAEWKDMPEDEQYFWILVVGTVLDIVKKKYE